MCRDLQMGTEVGCFTALPAMCYNSFINAKEPPMQNPRFHGNPPYFVIAIHGGPGAQGAAWPFAQELGKCFGVLEPLQTARTVDGQVEELKDFILTSAVPPVTLIGHSWGAWLAFIFAARYPELAGKLILVGSGPFLESWTAGMMDTRLSHLTQEEAAEVSSIMSRLGRDEEGGRDALLARMGTLMTKADTFCPAPPGEPYETVCDAEINRLVWNEAAQMRRSGELLGLAGSICCPVLAIHGDYDPHPWQGVKEPLEEKLKDFRFILLERCGHEPWAERYARDSFYDILKSELGGEPC